MLNICIGKRNYSINMPIVITMSRVNKIYVSSLAKEYFHSLFNVKYFAFHSCLLTICCSFSVHTQFFNLSTWHWRSVKMEKQSPSPKKYFAPPLQSWLGIKQRANTRNISNAACFHINVQTVSLHIFGQLGCCNMLKVSAVSVARRLRHVRYNVSLYGYSSFLKGRDELMIGYPSGKDDVILSARHDIIISCCVP